MHPSFLARRHPRLARVAAAWLLSLAIASPGFAETSCPTPSDVELEVIDRINAERASDGIAPVELDVRLLAAALRHSEDMRDGCFLSHTGSDGSTRTSRMLDAGYPDPGREAAGAGQSSAASIVSGWMNSSAHRAILLDDRHRHVGVGYGVGTGPCVLQPYNATIAPHFWTADFGEADEPAQQSCAPLVPECSDGIDNDGNGLTDTEDVLRCRSPDDPREELPCRDGIDNDGDDLVDYPEDPECGGPDQVSEWDPRCGLGFELVLLLGPLAATRRR